MEIKLPSYSELRELTEEERSVITIESLRTVIVNQTNHLRHHWAVTIACLSAGIVGMINLGIAMVILFFKVG